MTPRTTPVLATAGVLLLAGILLAIPAGRRPFWSQDEARFALLARNIVTHGGWLVPELRGRPYLNKPQLYFWTIAVASLPGGRVTERTAAVPSVLSGIATVAAVVAIGRRLWGWRAGALAGLILATTPFHFQLGHNVLPDAMLVAWLTWALWAYLAAGERAWPPRLVGVFYGCVAGALLTKGPVALVALLAVGAATVLTNGWRGVGRMRPMWGAAILGAGALPWIVPYYARAREGFSEGVVKDQYLRWVLDNPTASGAYDAAARLTHVVSALPAFLPWTLLLVGAAVWWRRAPDRGRRRIIVWTVTWWLATSLSGNFRARYLLPVIPMFALLTGEFVATAARRHGRRILGATLAPTAVGIALLPLAGLVPGLLTGETRVFAPDTSWERATLAIIAIAGAAGALALAARSAAGAATVALALTVGSLLAVEGVTYPRRYSRAYDVRPLAASVQNLAPRDAPVIGHPDLKLSYDFYLDRQVVEALSAEAVRARLTDPAPAVIVTSAERWAALAPGAASDWRVATTATVGRHTMVVVSRTTP